jgi:N utilization substance protein A
MKGSRVQNVVQELRGEKIDIIPWHIDQAKFVCNALAPAEISRVIIDEDHKSMEVIVPDEFLSIAIGKKGQNVRLASKLTGWHLDVKSESSYNQAMQSGYNSLMALPGVSISLADALYEKGFYSAEEIGKASVEDLLQVRGINEEAALSLIAAGQVAAEEAAAEAEAREAAGPDDTTEATDAAEAEASEAAGSDDTAESTDAGEPAGPGATDAGAGSETTGAKGAAESDTERTDGQA